MTETESLTNLVSTEVFLRFLMDYFYSLNLAIMLILTADKLSLLQGDVRFYIIR